MQTADSSRLVDNYPPSSLAPETYGLLLLGGIEPFPAFANNDSPQPLEQEPSPSREEAQTHFSPDSAFFNFDAFSPLAPAPGELDMDTLLGAFLGTPTQGVALHGAMSAGVFDVDSFGNLDSGPSEISEARERSDHWRCAPPFARVSHSPTDESLRRVARAWPTFYEAPPITVLPQPTGSTTPPNGTAIDDSTLKILQAGLTVSSISSSSYHGTLSSNHSQDGPPPSPENAAPLLEADFLRLALVGPLCAPINQGG